MRDSDPHNLLVMALRCDFYCLMGGLYTFKFLGKCSEFIILTVISTSIIFNASSAGNIFKKNSIFC